MLIIKLDATASTNATLKELWQKNDAENWTVVWTQDQFEGRGQKGTVWQSEAGKNLTFSVLKTFSGFNIQLQFMLSMAVSLAIYEALTKLSMPEIRVKWPNDIMSGRNKICGILIENVVKAKEVRASVIGIGVNINQEDFGDIPRAASLKMITGLEYELDEVLDHILNQLRLRLDNLENKDFEAVKEEYLEVLYRRNEMSLFKFPDGTTQNSIIRDVSRQGKIRLEKDNAISEFTMKEVQLLD